MGGTNNPPLILKDNMNETTEQYLQDPLALDPASDSPFVYSQVAGLQGSPMERLKDPFTLQQELQERQYRELMAQGRITMRADANTPLGLGVVKEQGTRAQAGQSASDYSMLYHPTKGWGEGNLADEKRKLEFARGVGERFIKTGGEESWFQDMGDWGAGFADGFSRLMGPKAWSWNEETEFEKLKQDIPKRDEKFIAEKWDRLAKWQESNPDANEFIQKSGVNLAQRIQAANNEKAFNVAIYESALDATLSHRMKLYDEDHTAVYKFADQAWEGFKDPLVVRDIALTTALTFGLGLAASPVTSAAATTTQTVTQRAANYLLMRTGPTIGLIEGPTYMLLKDTILKEAGTKLGQTLAARSLAMATEGFVAGTVSNMADQKSIYDWRKLTVNDLDKAFEYDYGEAITTGAVSGLGAMMMLGTMRFIVGLPGDMRYIREGFKTGDWGNWRRNVANSLDTWATTKEGRVIWGETLSDGRGVFFGDKIDKLLKKNDNRDFASVMVNGSRLFGKLDSRIAAKMNLDIKEATKVAEAFEAATGIAGEAAMRKLNGVDPQAGHSLMLLLNKEWLKANDLDYDTVARTLNEYSEAKAGRRMGPTDLTGSSRMLDSAQTSSNHVSNIMTLVQLRMTETNMHKLGIDPRTVLSDTESQLGRKLDLTDRVDFKNHMTVALAHAGDIHEDRAFKFLDHVFNGADDEIISIQGRAMPRSIAKEIVRKMMSDDLDSRSDELRFINNGGDSTDKATYIITYDPKTNTVSKTKRTVIKSSENGKDVLKVTHDIESHEHFKNKDNLISSSEMQAKLEASSDQLDAAFKKTVNDHIAALKAAGKLTPQQELVMKSFDDGVAITPEALRNMFPSIGVRDSNVMTVIMSVLGYDAKKGLLRIAQGDDSNIERGVKGNIVMEAGRALIQARKSADIGTFTHETAHFGRLMFINEAGLRDRGAIGISDSDWIKFLKWVGNEDNIWTTDAKFAELEALAASGDKDASAKIKRIIAAEEKFANGWTTYIKNVLKGTGKGPSTSVQRLLHRIGDHLGDIDKKFDSQEQMLRNSPSYQKMTDSEKAQARIDMGLEEDAFASEIFAKLSNRSGDELELLFYTADRAIFSKLDDEAKRAAIGEEILGLAAWTNYQARIQKEIATARVHTDPTVAASSLPKVKKTKVKTKIKEAVAEAKAVISPAEATEAAPSLEGGKTVEGLTEEPRAITDEASPFVTAEGHKVELNETEATVAVVTAVENVEIVGTHERATKALQANTLEELLAVETPESSLRESAIDRVAENPINLEEEAPSVDPVQILDVAVTRMEESRAITSELPAAERRELEVLAKGIRDNPDRQAELVALWLRDTGDETQEGRKAPRPSVEYLEAELRYVIARETIDTVSGLTDNELKRFLATRERLRLVETMPSESRAMQSQSDADIAAFASDAGLSVEDVTVYFKGMDQINKQMQIAELIKSRRYAAEHLDEQADLVKYLEDNKVAYDQAKSTGSDKRLVTSYEKKLGERQTFLNAEKRSQLGMIPDDIVEVETVKALESGVWKLEDFASYQHLYTLFSKIDNGELSVDIHDVLVRIGNDENTINTIADRLGYATSPDKLNVVKQFIAGKKDYNGVAWDVTNKKAANAYIKGVIKNMTRNVERAQRGTRKTIASMDIDAGKGKIDVASDRLLQRVELGTRINNESELLTYTAGHFYDRLVAAGEHELAEYFAARRATYWLPGNREDNLNTAYTRRYPDQVLTAEKIAALEKKMTRRLSDFGEELAEAGLDAEMVKQITKGRLNTIASKSVLNQAALDVINILRDPSDKATVLAAVEQFINDPNHSVHSRSILRKIAYGDIKNGFELWTEAFNNPNFGVHPLVAQYLMQLQELPNFENTLRQIGVFGLRGFSGGMYMPKTHSVAFSLDRGTLSISLYIHELVHAFTMSVLREQVDDTFGADTVLAFNLLQGEEFIDHLKMMVAEKPNSWAGQFLGLFVKVVEERPDMIKYANDPDTFNDDLAAGLVDYDDYGLTDVYEFMSEALSNPSFLSKSIFNPERGIEMASATDNLAFPDTLDAKILKPFFQLIDPNNRHFLETLEGAKLTPNVMLARLSVGAVIANFRRNWEYPFSTLRNWVDGSRVDDFIRIHEDGTIHTYSDFIERGVDHRLKKSVLGQKAVVDSMSDNQLKLRADLSAAKGRVFEMRRALNQQFMQIALAKEDWELQGPGSGSNPAVILKNLNGTKFYLKSAKSQDHAVNEIIAQEFYNYFDIPVVRSHLILSGEFGLQGPMLLSKWKSNLAGKIDPSFPITKEIKNTFIISAWLANWDILGLDGSNLDATGTVMDTGGSLMFRAQGQPKGDKFGNTVGELETLLDPNLNATAHAVFKGLTDADKIDQAITLKHTMTDEAITNIVNENGALLATEIREQLIKTLIARRDYIYNKLVPQETVETHVEVKLSALDYYNSTMVKFNNAIHKELSQLSNADWTAKDSPIFSTHAIAAAKALSDALIDKDITKSINESMLIDTQGQTLSAYRLILNLFDEFDMVEMFGFLTTIKDRKDSYSNIFDVVNAVAQYQHMLKTQDKGPYPVPSWVTYPLTNDVRLKNPSSNLNMATIEKLDKLFGPSGLEIIEMTYDGRPTINKDLTNYAMEMSTYVSMLIAEKIKHYPDIHEVLDELIQMDNGTISKLGNDPLAHLYSLMHVLIGDKKTSIDSLTAYKQYYQKSLKGNQDFGMVKPLEEEVMEFIGDAELKPHDLDNTINQWAADQKKKPPVTMTNKSPDGKIDWNNDDIFNAKQSNQSNSPNDSYIQNKYGIGDLDFDSYSKMCQNSTSSITADVSNHANIEIVKGLQNTLEDDFIYVNHKGIATDKGPNGKPSTSGGADFAAWMCAVTDYWPETIPIIKALAESGAKFDNGNRAFELICRLTASKYTTDSIKDMIMSKYGSKKDTPTASSNMEVAADVYKEVHLQDGTLKETAFSEFLSTFNVEKAPFAVQIAMLNISEIVSKTVARDWVTVNTLRSLGVIGWDSGTHISPAAIEAVGSTWVAGSLKDSIADASITADITLAALLGHMSGSGSIFVKLYDYGIQIQNPMQAMMIVALLEGANVKYYGMSDAEVSKVAKQLWLDIKKMDTKLALPTIQGNYHLKNVNAHLEKFLKDTLSSEKIVFNLVPDDAEGKINLTLYDKELISQLATSIGLDPNQHVSLGMSHGVKLWMALASFEHISDMSDPIGLPTTIQEVLTAMSFNNVMVSNFKEAVEVISFLTVDTYMMDSNIQRVKTILAERRRIEASTSTKRLDSKGPLVKSYVDAKNKLKNKYQNYDEWQEDMLFDILKLITNNKWNSIPEVVSELRLLLNEKTMPPGQKLNAFKVLSRIRKHVIKGDQKFVGDPVKFKEYFLDAEGKNIMVKNDFDIPILFYRGIGEKAATELVDQVRGPSKFSWWGETYEVARDYGPNGSMVTAYAKIDEKNILKLPIAETRSWREIPFEDIAPFVARFLTPSEFATFREKMAGYGHKHTCDLIADILINDMKIERIHAIRFDNLIDLTREGSKVVPHSQWTIRHDINIMKSPDAIDFDKTPGPTRILNQKRLEDQIKTKIADAKALGKSTEKLEAELADLEASADIRRRNLREAGFSEEIEPDDMKAIKEAIKGNSGLSEIGTHVYMDRLPGQKRKTDTSVAKARIAGKNYRDLNDDERRMFVTDILMPKIMEIMGNRNTSAGLFSTLTDSKVGRGLNSFVGGAVRYGDTADSSSISLQFLSKILDPTMDLRDGELKGVFDLFSVDLINAEKNNMYSRSGLLQMKDKIRATISNEAEVKAINDAAWKYLANIDDIPDDLPNKELVAELIKTVHKYNELTGEVLQRSGLLDGPMDPAKYGTVRRVNELAWTDAKGFAEALVNHVLKRTRDSGELSIITADALGWCSIKRASDGDDKILSVTITEDSPMASFLKPGEYQWGDKELMSKLNVKFLSDADKKIHDRGLESSVDYKESWKKMYAHRGDSYSAIRRDMNIARDRYIGADTGESKTGKPRHENVGGGRNFSEERILTHSEVAMNPDLAKYFQSDIYDLINQQLNSSYTEALMTDHIHKLFGTRMSWLDMVHILRKYGEETMDRSHMSSKDLKRRSEGFQRMIDVWEFHTGKLLSGRDGLDRYYESVLNGMRIPVLLLGGTRASLSSIPEVGRALIASNMHKPYVAQLPQNLWFLVKNLVGAERRMAIKEIASATHWVRGLTADHLLGRHEVNVTNPFAGVTMGGRQPGLVARFVNDWKRVGIANKAETNNLTKALNYVGPIASRIGYPLAWVNDLSTVMHIRNAQMNFTENSASFLKLAEMLEREGEDITDMAEFNRLAKQCGLGQREALSLSTSGLLKPETIRIIHEMSKDQSLYSDGMLDSQKMFLKAGDDEAKIDAINRMGSFINMTIRNTNTEPTLLDLRVNQSPYAKAMDIFMQFIISHSIQEIGKRRRNSTRLYGTHLAGLILMEIIATSVIRGAMESDREQRRRSQEDWLDYSMRVATSMPLMGGYGWLARVMYEIYAQTRKGIDGGGSADRINIPDVYGGPSDSVGSRSYKQAWEIFRGVTGQ